MDTLLLDGYSDPIDIFKFKAEPIPDFSAFRNSTNRVGQNNVVSIGNDGLGFVDSRIGSNDLCYSVSADGDSQEVPDFSDACLKFITDILLEEDLDERPAMVQDYRALQATEQSLYDVIGEAYPPSTDQFVSTGSSHGSIESGTSENANALNWVLDETTQFEPFPPVDISCLSFSESVSQFSGSTNSVGGAWDGPADSPVSILATVVSADRGKMVNLSREKKNHIREDSSDEEERSNKLIASYNEEYLQMEQYDDVLLCREGKEDPPVPINESSTNESTGKTQRSRSSKGSKGRSRGRKQSTTEEEVDLRTLLTHCGQAVSNFDLRSANELLKQIRNHSSAHGDSIQRVAHHFANGLEARLAGTGSQLYTDLVNAPMTASEFLKAYRVYVRAIPFKRTSFFLANQTVLKLAEKASKIHIIDFGIFLGLQWPCLIQNLSKRSIGPPKLRVTGIDFPQQGFRPAERVEETGRRLKGYCERFNVTFEYRAIAQKWDTIRPEDLNVDGDELVIVNCMYRSATLLDETLEENSPKDAFLRLVKDLNPNLFIHGVINGTFNAPFFMMRFKEALFHYSSVFDLFEATIPREAPERQMIERELYGKEVLNVIACEGGGRVQRPETYKQWQVRKLRAGFKQIPIAPELVKRAKAMVKANYHKDFVVDEDRRWMLQGWKGRIFCAISLWTPA